MEEKPNPIYVVFRPVIWVKLPPQPVTPPRLTLLPVPMAPPLHSRPLPTPPSRPGNKKLGWSQRRPIPTVAPLPSSSTATTVSSASSSTTVDLCVGVGVGVGYWRLGVESGDGWTAASLAPPVGYFGHLSLGMSHPDSLSAPRCSQRSLVSLLTHYMQPTALKMLPIHLELVESWDLNLKKKKKWWLGFSLGFLLHEFVY